MGVSLGPSGVCGLPGIKAEMGRGHHIHPDSQEDMGGCALLGLAPGRHCLPWPNFALQMTTHPLFHTKAQYL